MRQLDPDGAGATDARPRDPMVRVFGGIGVEGDDGPISIGGHRQRRLLALLVLRAGSVAGLDWLAEHLWDDLERPEATTPALRTYVSRLRRALPEPASAWIATDPGGYRFVAPAELVEHRRFVALREEATRCRSRGDPLPALELLDEALGLWRGDPFPELDDVAMARAEIEGLKQDRLETLEERWEVSLSLGRHTQITGELAAFTAEHGLRNRAAQQYALALHRSGRTPESLRVIASHQREVIDETGLDPSPEIVELERMILAGDPALSVEQFGRPLRGYRLIEQAGAGAFSVVWRGVQPSVEREVAVKQIRSELACQPEFIRRFEAEAQLVARLEHPHIVPLIDFWREPDSAYLVMRWLGGGTLEQRLGDGPLSVDDTLTLAAQIGGALSTAHASGVVHRDVKAANILFDRQGNSWLGDFGIALDVAQSAGPETALSPGSPAYSSPEQIRQEQLGPASDVFSLGVVVFECLSGALPFTTSTSLDELIRAQLHDPYPLLSELRSDVPAAVVDAVARATAKRASERFGSIAEFLDALTPAGRPEAVHVPIERSTDEPRGPLLRPAVDNPYMGLRPFDYGDNDHFFGRESLVSDLVDRLSGETIQSRCLVVVGPSGSGKSSLVRAGLVPALRAGAAPGSAEWFTTTMTPGNDPFESLEAALLRIAVDPPLSLVGELRRGKRGVLRGVRSCLGSDDEHVLVTIDQFEELFIGASAAQAHAFLDALAVAVEEPTSPLKLVATLRADYFDRPLEHPAFSRVLGDTAVNVTPLAPNELESAIVEPAWGRGVEFEAGLLARIAAETISQPSPLPLLQYTLSELFDRRVGDRITAEAYDEIGGLTGAVAARAEAIHTEAGAPRASAIRRVFGRMANASQSSADLRRRVPVADLADDPDAAWVLDRYGAARLLTFDRDVTTREPTVEVAHEALLREWPRLVGWLDEDRDLLRSAEAVAAAATAWDQGGRSGADLYRGDRLESAVDLVRSAPERLRHLDRDFIEASRVAAEAARRTEARRIRRLRRLVAAAAVAVVIALVAGGLALRQSNRADAEAARAQESAAEAEAQARRAESQTRAAVVSAQEADLATIVSRSAAEAEGNPELSVLLALEAHRRAPGTATEQAVLNALGSNTFASRVSGFGPLSDPSGPCRDTVTSKDGLVEFGVTEGQLVTRDPATGDISEHGPAPGPCVQWLGSESTGRRVAVSEDGLRMWAGPYDGPWDVELAFETPTFLVSRSLESTHRLVFESGRGGLPELTMRDDTTGELVGSSVREGIEFQGSAANSDGSQIALAFRFLERVEGIGLIVIVDGSTGEELMRFDSPYAVNSLVFDDARNELIVGASDQRTIATLDIAAGDVVATIEAGTASRFLETGFGIRSDGVVIAVSESRIELLDRRSGSTQRAVPLRNVASARVRPDGTVLTISADHRVSIIDPDSNPLASRIWPVEPFAEISFSAGRAAVVQEPSGAVEVIDLETGARTTSTPSRPDGEPLIALAALPVAEGEWVVAGGDHQLTRWDDGQLRETLQLEAPPWTGQRHGNTLATILTSPQGYEVVQLVDLEPGESSVSLTIPVPNASASIPSTDGGVHVLTQDGVLRTYDSSGRELVATATTSEESQLIALDEATGRVALPGASGTVLIVDPLTGDTEVLPIVEDVQALGFARGGQLLTIVATDGSVRLWDLERGESAGIVWTGSGAASAASPWYDEVSDSIWVASSGRLLSVPLDPARWVERACEVVGRDFTQDEWNRFVPGDLSMQSACD